MEEDREGGNRFKVTRLMGKTSSGQYRSLGWCQGPSPVWLEDGALQQSRVMGEGLGLFREPDPCASLSSTWHVSQVAKGGADTRFILQEMEPPGHFGAVLGTPERQVSLLHQ